LGKVVHTVKGAGTYAAKVSLEELHKIAVHVRAVDTYDGWKRRGKGEEEGMSAIREKGWGQSTGRGVGDEGWKRGGR